MVSMRTRRLGDKRRAVTQFVNKKVDGAWRLRETLRETDGETETCLDREREERKVCVIWSRSLQLLKKNYKGKSTSISKELFFMGVLLRPVQKDDAPISSCSRNARFLDAATSVYGSVRHAGGSKVAVGKMIGKKRFTAVSSTGLQ